MRVVGISDWITGTARNSKVFNSFDIQTIHNCVDTDVFFPLEQPVCRSLLKISSDKKVVLIGAQTIDDFYKGFNLFVSALKFIDPEKFHICTFGRMRNEIHLDARFTLTNLGYLSDSIALRIAYGGADVFVAPSIQEAFGKTIAESMACGTPVVCFDSTGPKDIVDHKINGYLATSFEAEDLASGINWICFNNHHLNLRNEARKKVVNFFSKDVIAQKYKALYTEITTVA